jgi:hypothetical protein
VNGTTAKLTANPILKAFRIGPPIVLEVLHISSAKSKCDFKKIFINSKALGRQTAEGFDLEFGEI